MHFGALLGFLALRFGRFCQTWDGEVFHVVWFVEVSGVRVSCCLLRSAFCLLRVACCLLRACVLPPAVRACSSA